MAVHTASGSRADSWWPSRTISGEAQGSPSAQERCICTGSCSRWSESAGCSLISFPSACGHSRALSGWQQRCSHSPSRRWCSTGSLKPQHGLRGWGSRKGLRPHGWQRISFFSNLWLVSLSFSSQKIYHFTFLYLLLAGVGSVHVCACVLALLKDLLFCRQTQTVPVNPIRRRSSSRMSLVRKKEDFFFFNWCHSP